MMLDRLRRRISLTIRRRPLLPFLVAATVVGDFLIDYLAPRNDRVLALAAVFAQSGLLGVWCGQLRRGWLLRGAMAALAIGMLCYVVFSSDRRPPLSETLTIMLVYAASIGAVGAGLRFLGRAWGRLRNNEAGGRVQFSIGGILTTTTCVAIALSLLRYADFPGGDPAPMVLGCGALGSLPLVIDQVVRRTRRVRVAVLGGMLVSPICAFAFLLGVDMLKRPRSQEWFIAIVCQGVFYLVWLLALRSRLHEVAPKAPPLERLRAVSHQAPQRDDPVEEPTAPKPLDLKI